MPPAPRPVPSPIVALVAWLVPGAGYWLVGQRARGLTVGITVLTLFVGGLWIGGLRVVEAPPMGTGGPLRYPLQVIQQRPWFIGQFLAGPISLVPVIAKNSVPPGELAVRLPASHVRVNEIGTLYTAIAGMLNLLTIIDAAYRAGRGGK